MISETLTQLHPVSQGALAAIIYGTMFFSYVRLDPDNPETFEPIKFGTTVFLGAVIGGIFGAAGITPTYESIGHVLTAYAGTIALTEAAIKALINGNKRRAKSTALEALEVAFGTTVSRGRSRVAHEREIERGASEFGEQSNDERREEWDRRWPDPDTEAQLDESDGREGSDATATADAGTGTGTDANREDDELPPA